MVAAPARPHGGFQTHQSHCVALGLIVADLPSRWSSSFAQLLTSARIDVFGGWPTTVAWARLRRVARSVGRRPDWKFALSSGFVDGWTAQSFSSSATCAHRRATQRTWREEWLSHG